VVRIPDYNLHHTLFYEDIFFKGKLASQIGFDVHYSSAYFSNAYTPATSVFYQQNSKETNGYALVDFFFNFKIKSARLTFKIQNIGDNIIASNYQNTPYYPMAGTVIQFGVTWRFFDE
jgi:outer membrane cobalamin receptor